MKKIITIFKKELIDSMRDRRTMITMILLPLLLYPVLIMIASNIMISQMEEAQMKKLNVGYYSADAASLLDALYEAPDINVIRISDEETGRQLVKSDSLDGFVRVDDKFSQMVDSMKPAKIMLYYKATDREPIERNRIRNIIADYEQKLLKERFEALELDLAIIEPVELEQDNLASTKEQLANVIGGFLPYLFIIFCFIGSMYPAIDLAAGEKERGTLETLLTAPATRFQILTGKFGVVVLTGFFSAAISILGMYIGVRQIDKIPPEIFDAIINILQWDSIVMLLSLLLPLTIFFAGVLLSLSIFAKSFKEAQSMVTPLMIVIIIPAFIGLMPGMTLNAVTALIPILNLSLATKAIIAGNYDPLILIEVYASLILLAFLSLAFVAVLFKRESVIFR